MDGAISWTLKEASQLNVTHILIYTNTYYGQSSCVLFYVGHSLLLKVSIKLLFVIVW